MLASLDRRMLADIGITRADLRDAFSEPFWDDPTALLRERAHRAAPEPAVGAPSRLDAARPPTGGRQTGRARRSDEIKQTADPSHRPLDPAPAIIPSRGRIQRPPAPPAGAYLNLISARRSLLTLLRLHNGECWVTMRRGRAS